MTADLDSALKGTNKNLFDVCQELGIDMPDPKSLSCDQCCNCNRWFTKTLLKLDLDGNPICGFCWANYGP